MPIFSGYYSEQEGLHASLSAAAFKLANIAFEGTENKKLAENALANKPLELIKHMLDISVLLKLKALAVTTTQPGNDKKIEATTSC